MGNRATSALGALLLLTGGLAGCSGDAAAPNPTSGVSAAAALAAVKAKVDAASSVHLTLAGKGLPDRVSGVVSADGVGTHAPAFKGTLQVKVNRTQAATDVVAVGGKVYVKLPFTSISTAVDPATLGAPNPAQLFAVDNGITSLLTATQNPVAGERTRKGSEVLKTYSGTLSGAQVADLLVVGDRATTFRATYGVTDPGGELRTVELTGPFYPGGESTYDLTLDRYGEPVEITTP